MPTTSVRVRPSILPLEDRAAPAAGDLDLTFGTRGRVAQPFDYPGLPDVVVGDMAVQSDGRIVLAGGQDAFEAARLNPDGTPDPTFGTGGAISASLRPGAPDPLLRPLPQSKARAVAVQPDGKIVLAGEMVWLSPGGHGFEVLRLDPDGTPDLTFGAGGWAVVPFPAAGAGEPPAASATDVAVQPDGRIVVAGYVSTGPGGWDFAAARLNPDGSPDPTFGVGGRVTIGFGWGGDPSHDHASAVLLQPDGRIVLIGEAGSDIAAVRLAADGGLDPTFGAGGRAVLPDPPGATNNDYVSAGALQPDGRILVLGTTYPTSGDGEPVFTVARLNPDGTPDETFGAGGRTPQTPGDPTFRGYGQGVALQPDGRIVVASFSAVVRLNADGTPDRTFGAAGRAAEDLGGQDQGVELWTPAVLPDGKILVGGNAAVSPSFEGHFFGGFLVARLLGDAPPPPVLAGGRDDGTAVPLRPAGGTYSIGEPIAFFPGAAVGVRTAAADVTGDGVADFVGGAGPGGGPRVAVVDGATGRRVADFFAFESAFAGGVFVAAADLNGDGRAEVVVTPDRGGGPVVAVFDGAALAAGVAGELARFLGIDDPAFRGGARVAAGDVNGDQAADVVVSAGFGGGPRVAVFDGKQMGPTGGPKLFGDFFAFETELRNGTYITAGDVTGDGFADLAFGGGPGGAPRVRVFDGAALVAAGGFSNLDDIPAVQRTNFFAGDPSLRGGVRLAMRDVDGDGRADLVTGSGEGEPSRVRVYRGTALLANPDPAADQELDPFAGTVLADGVFIG